MCGIVAEHGGSDSAALERMLERLTHRGPDDHGTLRVGDAWLGHRRLSIVDLESGAPQALAALNGMFAVVAAGEDGRFVAARDPVGIKPLYWARRDGIVRFASELGAFDPEVRWAVESFPPGSYWTPEAGLVPFAEPVPPLAPSPSWNGRT